MKRKNILLVFGGDSCERDISVITAIQAYENIDLDQYNIIPVYLFEHSFYFIKQMKTDIFINFHPKEHSKIYIVKNGLFIKRLGILNKHYTIDCALLALHGGTGENGAVQGLFDVFGIPYTSCKIMSSAVFMDKSVTKRILDSLDIRNVRSITIRKGEPVNFGYIEKTLGYPVIVKPCNLGSSIGIGKASGEDTLKDCIELAFFYDDNIIIERALTGFEEYNCAVIRNKDEIIVSDIERPIAGKDILKFDDKYLTNGKINGGYREYPANISRELKKRIEDISVRLYKELNMAGVVRIDYLYKDDVLYLNEVNTIPGSLAYYLFDKKGIDYRRMIDMLIDTALYDKEMKDNLISYYNSSVLNYAKNFANKLLK